MLKFEAHSRNILSLIKDDIVNRSDLDTPDVIIICKNEEMVQTQRTLLGVFSSTLRDIFGSVLNMETFMVFMPDYKKVTVEKVIRMLRLEWREEELFDTEVVQLFKCLNMDVGGFHLKVKEEPKPPVSVVTESENHMKETPESYQDFHNKEIEESDNLETAQTQPNIPEQSVPGSNDTKKVKEAKCPNCSRQFSGTSSRLRDMMRCHLGQIHFQSELMVEIKAYFPNSVVCKECKKSFQSTSAKKKHLVFHHTRFVDMIQSIVSRAIDLEANNQDETIETATAFENPLTSLQGITITVKKDEELKELNHGNISNEANMHSTDDRKEPIDFSAFGGLTITKGSPVVANGTEKTLTCVFPCDKRWRESESQNLIKYHLLSHFKQQFSEQHDIYFKGKKCIKCPSNKTALVNNTLKDKHLFGKHGVLKADIESCLDSVLKQSSNDDIEKNKENNTASDKEMQERYLDLKRVNDPNKNDLKDEIQKNENDEIDSLLKSDDEDMDETGDIQKLLLADVSDDDSDEEDGNTEGAFNKIFVEKARNRDDDPDESTTDMAIQNQLL